MIEILLFLAGVISGVVLNLLFFYFLLRDFTSNEFCREKEAEEA